MSVLLFLSQNAGVSGCYGNENSYHTLVLKLGSFSYVRMACFYSQLSLRHLCEAHQRINFKKDANLWWLIKLINFTNLLSHMHMHYVQVS